MWAVARSGIERNVGVEQVAQFTNEGGLLLGGLLCSTLYHSFHHPRIKRYFQLMDHLSIYLLIAGTYTPITLVPMRGPWGWTLFGLIWAMAACGILAKILLFGRLRYVSVAFYLAMDWLVVIAVRPMLEMLPGGLIVWIGAGGFFYTLGAVFVGLTRLRYHHTIWNLFVLAGSLCHFLGIRCTSRISKEGACSSYTHGGFQERYDVRPDLTALGKIIGGVRSAG